jgi:hypothetical protein
MLQGVESEIGELGSGRVAVYPAYAAFFTRAVVGLLKAGQSLFFHGVCRSMLYRKKGYLYNSFT